MAEMRMLVAPYGTNVRVVGSPHPLEQLSVSMNKWMNRMKRKKWRNSIKKPNRKPENQIYMHPSLFVHRGTLTGTRTHTHTQRHMYAYPCIYARHTHTSRRYVRMWRRFRFLRRLFCNIPARKRPRSDLDALWEKKIRCQKKKLLIEHHNPC